MLTSGTLAGVMMVLLKSYTFADVVNRREARIQRALDMQACVDTVYLMKSRDVFLRGDMYIRDFNCRVHVDQNGEVRITADQQGLPSLVDLRTFLRQNSYGFYL